MTEIAGRLLSGSLFGVASFALSLTPADEEIEEIRAVLDALDQEAIDRDR